MRLVPESEDIPPEGDATCPDLDHPGTGGKWTAATGPEDLWQILADELERNRSSAAEMELIVPWRSMTAADARPLMDAYRQARVMVARLHAVLRDLGMDDDFAQLRPGVDAAGNPTVLLGELSLAGASRLETVLRSVPPPEHRAA